MDSDESNFSDEELDLFDDSVMPYRFEPRYTEKELQDMVEHERDAMSSDNSSDLSWCKCGHCSLKENIVEKICCKNPLILSEDDFEHFDCITMATAFTSVCLDRNVLKTALGSWREFRDEKLPLENKNFRFISYKQYIWWSYGYLGKNRRKPLPNCVIQKIREVYPEANGNYIPYRAGK